MKRPLRLFRPMSNPMRELYPEITPYRTGHLKVDEEHTLYWEESGSPQGQPVLFLHGGPGSGTEPFNRRFFDPKFYRILLMDQRGSGKSKPFASLHNNTTWHLVSDIEQLRKHLGIDRWVVFGGSWGSSLALSYAIQFPEKVKGLIVRGIFLCRKEDILWTYQHGAHYIFPDAWENYIEPIPKEERKDFLKAYYLRLTSEDHALRMKAAKAWSGWEAITAKLRFDPAFFSSFTEDAHAESLSRIECHYFINNCFFPTDNWILEQIEKIRKIPGWIIHGRYDMVCPLDNAWKLHKAWPEATFEIIPDAGHAATEKGIIDALIRASDEFQNLS
jgi:proline iminopeptidase